MFFAGSRFASQWLNLGSPEGMTTVDYDEGSPLDRNVFLFLILAGIWVLQQRKLDWAVLFRKNIWIGLFFLFALISVLWSDAPIISFKRWIKVIGNLIMALIILTEQRPYEALGFILRRLGFLLLPLSVLFIKYYPDLGRAFHMGLPMFTGVTLQKNSLGQLCLITGIYFFWKLFLSNLKFKVSEERLSYTVFLIMLPMIVWLLYMAQSATAIACMSIVICILLMGRLPIIVAKPRRIINIGITCAVIYVLLDSLFDLKGAIILMLGRRPDLTDRDVVWELVLPLASNPLIGTGYESFWSGERLVQIWERVGMRIVQAHNGYIDIYLNLGIVGLVLLIASIISGFRKTLKHLETEYAYAVLKISFILTVLFSNYTEATIKPLSNLFVLLLVSLLELPNRSQSLYLRKVC